MVNRGNGQGYGGKYVTAQSLVKVKTPKPFQYKGEKKRQSQGKRVRRNELQEGNEERQERVTKSDLRSKLAR